MQKSVNRSGVGGGGREEAAMGVGIVYDAVVSSEVMPTTLPRDADRGGDGRREVSAPRGIC